MFCEQCAPLTQRLIFDPAAEPRAELMSGSCMWPDEINREWCIQCIWKLREWFHLRYQITVGEPVPAAALERWGQLEQEFPNWPLFRPERRSPEIAERVRQMVHRATRRACIDLERMDREYRRRQAEQQGREDGKGRAER
jgi:hypothetical protein